jgi:S-adenosylmethionine hydrolase
LGCWSGQARTAAHPADLSTLTPPDHDRDHDHNQPILADLTYGGPVGYDWLTLLTDYGTYDGFAAACHGVAARIAPHVRVIDITHEVPPGDIRRGAVVLAQTVPALPNAVHVAVVDPGVGTERRAIAVEAANGVLVGPDNGLLGWAADALGGALKAVELTDPAFHEPRVDATFHGRDIFTPAAAHLAAGVDIAALGAPIDLGALVRLPAPQSRVRAGEIIAEVLTIDRFGNTQTSANREHLAAAGLPAQIEVNGHSATLARAFGDVPGGALLAYLDSAGQLAIAVNGGDAARELSLRAGDTVTVRPAPDGSISA